MGLRKRIFKRKVLILSFIGVCFLSGCGQEYGSGPLSEAADNRVTEENDINYSENMAETEEDEEEDALETAVNMKEEYIRYNGNDEIDLLRAMHRCASDGEKIYLAYGEPDLYVMPMGADEHSRVYIDNPKEMDICHVAMDPYGRIHLLAADSDGDEWFIWRLDESGQIDKEIDISSHIETKQVPLWFLIDKEGNYYFQWMMNRNGIIIDSEGGLMHSFSPESLEIRWIYEAEAGRDGFIYLVYGDQSDTLKIGALNMETCSIKKEESSFAFPGNETFSEMSMGTDTDFLLFSPYSGIWAYDKEKGILENRKTISDLNIPQDTYFWPLTFLTDGRLLLLERTENEVHLKYIPAGE